MRPITTFPVSSGKPFSRRVASTSSTAAISGGQSILSPITPIQSSLDEFYRCLLQFEDEEGGEAYHLAEAKPGTNHAHQVVMIRKINSRPCYRLPRPDLRILSVLDAFQSGDTMLLVLERPGILLSRVVLVPELNYRHVVTILKEIIYALVSLEEAGLRLEPLSLVDVSISSLDGTVKIAADTAKPIGDRSRPDDAELLQFASQIESYMIGSNDHIHKLTSLVNDFSNKSFFGMLKTESMLNAAPTSSLTSLALIADFTVLPDECSLIAVRSRSEDSFGNSIDE